MRLQLLIALLLPVSLDAKSLSAYIRQQYNCYFPQPVQTSSPHPIPLAVASMFQNEAPYLKEWIDFHQLMGVEHFYLYNHMSEDDYKAVLTPYIEEGIVELFDWHRGSTKESDVIQQQAAAFNDALDRARGQAKWLALLDIDEFLFPTQDDNLVAFLQPYDRFGAVAVSWQQYGTSEVKTLDLKRPMIEQLTEKVPKKWDGNWMIKSIVRPEAVLRCHDSHYCDLREGAVQVNEDGVPFFGSLFPLPEVRKIRINHYWTRDKTFMETVKAKRKDGKAAQLYAERKEVLNAVDDPSICRWASPC